jgi:DNA-binding NtrC family response regulator
MPIMDGKLNMGERSKILIIDDEKALRENLKAILEDQGYIVDTAKNGREAIRRSKQKFYNLALVDIRLPDIEGTKLLTSLADTKPKMVKIIITGHPSLQNAIDALNKGADAYIQKPFDVERTLTLIHDHLQKQKKEKKYCEDKVAEFIESRAKELDIIIE